MIKSGRYRFLHEYLDGRYADIVVLTFRQIEDLLGFALPAVARIDAAWWNQSAEPDWADVWKLAHRSPTPNFAAGHVTFERIR